jgi:hypothetical protein
MFDSTILDVAIGLVFIYLVLSLIGTATNEFLASLMSRRAIDLEKGLVELLQDNSGVDGSGVVASLYKHPLIDSLFKGDIGGTGARKPVMPSYIPSRSFALALLDLIQPRDQATPSAASGTTPSLRTQVAGAPASADQVQALRAALATSPLFAANADLSKAIHALIDAAGDDMAQVRANVEGWFNSAMDRVSGWYKRRTQYIILGIGLLLAMLANADTFAIGDALARQKALREALVSGASEYSKLANGPAPKAEDWLASRVEGIKPLGLPIGWKRSDLGVDFWLWVRRLLGWAVTAFAISLGAPFWFDVLNKFMIVRSTVKPHEKSQEQPSRD